MASGSFCILMQLLLTVARIYASEKLVTAKLLSTYDRTTRPIANDTISTNVTVFPDIKNLMSVVENQEAVKLLIYLRLAWRDDFLSWDPAEFNGTDVIRIPRPLIWQPDITVLSSMDTAMVIPADQEIAQVNSDGTVLISRPLIVSSYCPMRIANFPFDEQNCLLNISPWGYTALQVTVWDSGNPVTLAGNSEWGAECKFFGENIVHAQENVYKELHYILRFKRNPSFYVWVLILPTYLITCLSIAGIFMPNSSGDERIEKVTLGQATLLTMAVILNIVSEAMPKGADLPLLGYFVMGEIIICMMSLILSIAIIQIHHRVTTRDYQPPDWLTTVLFLPKMKHVVEKAQDKGHALDCKLDAVGHPIVRKQDSDKRRMMNAWTANLDQLTPQSMNADKNRSQPDFFDDLRQLVTDSQAYLNKIHLRDVISHQWVRIFGRIDTCFLISFQIINLAGTVYLLH